jgi:hypothetical protein
MSEQVSAEKKLDGITHAQGCHTWGHRHYECALRRIKELEQLSMRQANEIRKLQRLIDVEKRAVAAEHETQERFR